MRGRRWFRRAGLAAHYDALVAATDAEARVVELERALAELVSAVDNTRSHAVVPWGTIKRAPLGQDLAVKAPHLQDPRLAQAMRDATQVLAR